MRKTDDMDTPETRDRDPLFDALRMEMDKLDAPRGVEQALMQACAKQFPPKRRWYQALSPRAWTLGGGLAAAGVAVLLISPTLHLPRGGAPTAAADSRPLAARSDDGGLFIALDTLERIEQEPAPRMVETEVPRSSLASLGVSLTPENAGDSVRAEMLVAADGQPLALRLSSVE
jgi:hypothetical protein